MVKKYSYDRVKKMLLGKLSEEEILTGEFIRATIDLFLKALGSQDLLEDIDPEKMFWDLQTHVNVFQADSSTITDRRHTNWVPNRKSQISWDYWKGYREYLEQEILLPPKVLNQLDKNTDLYLGKIGNPEQKGAWDQRGMLTGEIQSGKTTTYTGLICKAADAGYKLFIVLAGMTNDLRSQTQLRLDLGFLGFNSEIDKKSFGKKIGAGVYRGAVKFVVHPLTDASVNGDFKKHTAKNFQLGSDPILLVVKKNKSILERVLLWAKGQEGKIDLNTGEKTIHDIPVFLLDDEGDFASVNTKNTDEDPTAINRVIRKILKTFAQSSYIGVTATPYANVFILPTKDDQSKYGNDLFPKDFISSIPPPSDYIGATKLFGLSQKSEENGSNDESLPLVRFVEDVEIAFPPKHKKDFKVKQLPESLKKAMQTFILVCAARRARKQKSVHNSMLVHVTRFRHVQEQVIEMVNVYLVEIQNVIRYRTGSSKFLTDLQNLWRNDFERNFKIITKRNHDLKMTPLEWNDIEGELVDAVSKIEVRGINSLAGGILDYENYKKEGLNVIAVGGG